LAQVADQDSGRITDIRCCEREGPTSGQTCLMPPQQVLATDGDHISEPVAAARHNFPEADIHSMSNRPGSNRPFAAQVSDVSHADLAAIRCN